MESPKFSFDGWSIVEFIKGRKKLLMAELGGILAGLGMGEPKVALILGIAAAVLEMGFAVAEFYFKKVKLK